MIVSNPSSLCEFSDLLQPLSRDLSAATAANHSRGLCLSESKTAHCTFEDSVVVNLDGKQNYSSTRVPHFLDSLLPELQNLEAELRQDSSHHDHDISVYDLKVFTEDELMDMALKQVFEGRENNENHPPLLNQPNSGCQEKNSRRKRSGTNNSILDFYLQDQ